VPHHGALQIRRVKQMQLLLARTPEAIVAAASEER